MDGGVANGVHLLCRRKCLSVGVLAFSAEKLRRMHLLRSIFPTGDTPYSDGDYYGSTYDGPYHSPSNHRCV